jgi:hypothetical protein
MSEAVTLSTNECIPPWKKFIFGSDDLSIASFGTLRQILYAIFLTDVVNLQVRDGDLQLTETHCNIRLSP